MKIETPAFIMVITKDGATYWTENTEKLKPEDMVAFNLLRDLINAFGFSLCEQMGALKDQQARRPETVN
jgi:hypothetical protein